MATPSPLAGHHCLLRWVLAVGWVGSCRAWERFWLRRETRECQMNSLSLSQRWFCMVMRVSAWRPSGLPRACHAWLTVESTRGSRADPPTIWRCTLAGHPLDLLTGSKFRIRRSDFVGLRSTSLTRNSWDFTLRLGLRIGPKPHRLFAPPWWGLVAPTWAQFTPRPNCLLFYFISLSICS